MKLGKFKLHHYINYMVIGLLVIVLGGMSAGGVRFDSSMLFLLEKVAISIILAVMNILPIPGLDGGHIVLLLYEGIMRKQPSPKAMEIIERIGLFILFGLMILAFSNDIMRFFF